jgi:hypothetical protein
MFRDNIQYQHDESGINQECSRCKSVLGGTEPSLRVYLIHFVLCDCVYSLLLLWSTFLLRCVNLLTYLLHGAEHYL